MEGGCTEAGWVLEILEASRNLRAPAFEVLVEELSAREALGGMLEFRTISSAIVLPSSGYYCYRFVYAVADSMALPDLVAAATPPCMTSSWQVSNQADCIL